MYRARSLVRIENIIISLLVAADSEAVGRWPREVRVGKAARFSVLAVISNQACQARRPILHHRQALATWDRVRGGPIAASSPIIRPSHHQSSALPPSVSPVLATVRSNFWLFALPSFA